MAIVQEGTPSLYENASATTVVIPYPAGIVAGELLLVQTAASSSFTPTGPAGWTLRSVQLSGIPAAIFYRVADGTESGSATFTVQSTANRCSGIMTRWSGVDTSLFDVADVKSAAAGVGYTSPTITTSTDSDVLVYTVSLGASASSSINTPAGITQIEQGGAGGGRRLFSGRELISPAGATGTRSWTQTGTASLQWSGIVTPLKPVAGAVTPTLDMCVNDIPNQTTMIVKVKTTGATSVRLKVGTDSAVSTGIIWGAATTPDSNSSSELVVSGLSPNTRYYYRVAMTNSASVEFLDTYTDVGTFKTDYNGPMNFSFAFGSCEANSFESVSFGAIATKNPDLFLHLGDEYYADGTGTSVANFVTKMTNKKNQTSKQKINRQSGTSVTPSDHDGMNNNSNAGTDATAWTNYNDAYRQCNPITDMASSGVYKSFRRGRVRFIRIDRRSFASNPADTDNSSKTCLGATQKAWFKTEIDNATEPLIIIQNADPWNIAAAAGGDDWSGYTTERTELANYMVASGKNFIILAGDMHALAGDNGTGTNNAGGFYNFCASPFNQNASQKGGPYSVGPVPSSGTALTDQYGWVDITDDGSTITAAFTGYSSTNTSLLTLTKTVVTNLDTSPTGIASSEAFGTPSNTLDVSVGPTGISSAEAFGTPSNTLDVTVTPTGITTGEAFGVVTITYGAVSNTPDGIVSSETWGNPTNNIAGGNLTYTPDGIASAEAWGIAANTYGAVSNTPDGITSGEAFGVTKIFMGNSMVLPKPLKDYSTGDLEYEFYRRQSGLSQGTFNDHKYTFMRNELGGIIEGTLDDIEYEYWKTKSGLTGKRFSLADHRIATFEQTNPGGFNDDGRTYFSQFFS